jgi:hypothetical protein
VNQEVEPPELFGSGPHDCAGALDLRDVAVDTAGRKDIPAFHLEPSGDRRPDSARSTGYEGAHEG